MCCLGRLLRVISPLIPSDLPEDLVRTPEATIAMAVADQVLVDVADTRDNLLAAKVVQAHSANNSRGKEVIYKKGDLVMLSTFNRQRDYKRKGEKCVAKFMPRWDGPYEVEKTHPETSNYTLVLLNSPHMFATFSGTCTRSAGAVMTNDGLEEYFIDRIVDSRHRGRGWQFLVLGSDTALRKIDGCLVRNLQIVKRLMSG